MMFRVRSKYALLPLAALLMAGCSGGDEEPAASASATTTAVQTPAEVDPSPGLELTGAALERAAEQAGPEGFGAVTCEAVNGVIQAGGSEDTVAEALGQVLSSVIKGAEKAGEVDVDATTQTQCPEVRTEALSLSGANTLKDLLPK